MGVTTVSGINAGLNTRATKFARSAVVEFIDRPHLDVFQQERLILPNIDLNMRLIPSPNHILCQSAVRAQGGQKEKKQVCNSERLSHHSHQEAHKHGSQGAHGFSINAEYCATLIARSNEAPVNSCEPDLYQIRQHFYWRFTGFSRSWSCERRQSRGWLPEKPVQLPKFWREPHRYKAQWHAQSDRWLYPEFRKRSVYKNLLDVSPRAQVRHWR